MTDAGGRGRSRRGRGTETPWIAPGGGGHAVRCQLCGAVNSGPAGFCRWCGTPLGRPTDPVLGTTTRRGIESREGSPIGIILGGIAATAVIAVTGWLLLGGGLAGGDPSQSPSPTAIAQPSLEPSPTFSPGPTITTAPTSPPEPTSSPEPSPEPTTSAEPSSPPTDTGFTCDPATIEDPNSATWTINNLIWAPRGRADELQIVLGRTRLESPRAAQVAIESVDPAQVIELYGIAGPITSRALVVTFSRQVGLSFVIDEVPGLDAVREVTIAGGSDDLVHAVIGVEGEGCYRLAAPDWELGTPPVEASIILSVRR